ncbi:MAG: RagB/SusD family nutrient uptake outer membrane protein [Leadbetterella sp.]|nr:RagB/SusD family nutrient uptake outer membrane protein [Leadbetterella sp.]
MKYIKIYTIAVLCGLLSGCSDMLEEKDFTYAVASSTFYNTPAEANAAVMAPLDMMRNAYGDDWFATQEINTEYVYPKGVYSNYAYREYNGFINATHVSRSATGWARIWRAIMFCNTAIGRLPEANAMSQEQISAYRAELRFLRAYNYLNLVRSWGGVPLRTEENITQWDLAKSSPAEIYAFVVNDLKYAVENCPDVPRIIGTPGKNAAKALLAEVYMYTKEYPEALRLSKEVMNSNAYSLVAVTGSRDFDKVFGYDLVTSTEEVFYIKTSRTDGKMWTYLGYTAHPNYTIDGKKMLNGNGYWTHYTDVRNTFIAEWDPKDFRKNLNVGVFNLGAAYGGTNGALLTKYWDPNSSGYAGNVSIPLIRYTDVLFTFAEASARVAGAPTAESLEAINKMRRRAYGKPANTADAALDYKLSDYSTLDTFIDLLIKESRYERMNEAKQWNFTVRLGRDKVQALVNKKRLDGLALPINEKHWLFNIPDSEFAYNKALNQATDQNPGYSN